MRNKGIERSIIFGFVIGIVILAIVIALVVNFTKDSRDKGTRASCVAEKQAYCAEKCYQGGSPSWPADCPGGAPSNQECHDILPGSPDGCPV